MQQTAAAEQRRLAAAAGQLQGHLAGLLRSGMTVMTCSLSSSVAAGLAAAATQGMKLRAIICESR